MTRKKLSARIISFFTVLAMIFTLMPNDLKAFAANIEDCIDFEITYIGLKPDANGVVENGESFDVSLHGTISSEYTDTDLPLEFTLKIDPNAVKLSGSGPIKFGDHVLGTYSFDTDGNIHITVDDSDVGRAFINQGDRSFDIDFSASVDVKETEDGSPVDTTVKIGEEKIAVTVQFPGSYLKGEKVASGKTWYDQKTGQLYQKYIIRQTAVNGDVDNVFIYDYMGEWLHVSAVNVTCNGAYQIRGNNDDAFVIYFPKIRKGETIEIEYTFVIDFNYVFNGNIKDIKARNQFGTEYDDQNGDHHSPSREGDVYPDIEMPGIDKSGKFTITGDEVIWTIVVDPGVFESADDFVRRFGITLIDKPGKGLEEEGQEIRLTSYEKNLDGTYTFTLVTRVTDEIFKQLQDISNTVTVHNDVETGSGPFHLSDSADATFDGIDFIDKKTTAKTADEDGRFAWMSTLTIPIEGINGLVFIDSTADSPNGHTILKDTIIIDGTPVSELEAAGKVSVIVSGKQIRISFSNEYLAELQEKNAAPHKVEGYQDPVLLADIVITYMTQPDNSSELDESYNFTNQSDIEFTVTDTNKKVTDSDNDKYSQNIKTEKYFTKRTSSSFGDWQISFDVKLDQLNVGDVFKITDIPDPNLEILEDTIIPGVYLNKENRKLSEIYSNVDNYLTYIKNKDGSFTFTFMVTQELYDAVYAALDEGTKPSTVYFFIAYYTRVVNESADAKYTNTAEGTYNDLPSEPSIVTKTIREKKPLSKSFIYERANSDLEYGSSNGKVNARFEVQINPSAKIYDGGEYIYLTDTMEGLIIIPVSVKLVDNATGETLENGVDYFINFDENEMYLTVPNGRSMTLTYMAEIEGEAPKNPGEVVNFEAANSIGLYVNGEETVTVSTSKRDQIFKSSAKASAQGYSITISKVSEINGTRLFPEGAEFKVERVSYDPQTGKFEAYTDNQQGENIRIAPVPGTNLTMITGLEPDAIYRLTETKAPEGYLLAVDPVYFMNPVNEINPNPVIINDIKDLGIYYFENEANFGGLKLTKTVEADNMSDAELRGGLRFTVRNEDGKYVDEDGKLHDEIVEIPFSSFKKKRDGSFVLTFAQLPLGKYTVTEINTEIPGYKLITDASVTEGDAVVTKGGSAEVELKNVYEEVGSLKLTKSIDGLNVTDEEKAGALTFTIKNKDGKYLDENGELHDEEYTITLDKFKKLKDGSYELDIDDVPLGKYTVTETNTEIEGYKFLSDASATEGDAEVTKGVTSDVELRDSYEEIGSLKITKSVDGLNVSDEEKAGALTFTVKNEDGKYLDEKGKLHDEEYEITLDKFKKQEDGTYVLELEDIATGKYTVTETNTEIEGYKFLSEESTTSGEKEVTKAKTSELELKDSYEEIGSLKITKSVDGLNVTDEEKAGALTFTVKNEDGKYLDENGDLHDEEYEITLDKFKKQEDGSYVLEFEDIATGKYTVTETNTEIEGYKLITEASTTSDTAEVEQSKTAEVELKDSYVAVGNLKITKTVDAENVTDEELNGALKFTVQNEDGKYLDENGDLHDEEYEITLDKFKKQEDGTYVLEFTEIEIGEYTVTETNTEIENYEFISEASTTSDTAEVVQSETAEIELKDSYFAIGNLKITKTVDAENMTDEELNGALKFTVQNEDGKYLDENGDLHDEEYEITLDKFKKQEDGTYVLEFEGIATGKYTVTETNTDVEGYEFTSGESVTEGEAEVTKGETAEIELKDSYEEIGSLKITKSIDGLNVTDEEKAGALKFTVQNEDGKYLDENGDLHDEIYEITLDKFQKQEDGTYVLEIKDIATGKYTVTETNTEIEGYKLISDTSVTDGDADVTKAATAEIKLEDNYYKTTSVTINKKDVANDEEVEGAKLEIFDKDGNKIDEWTSEKGKTHTIEGLKPGEEYTLKETITPDGYETATEIVFTVDEDGNATVVSGKDGSVDKDGVLIVNDTKKPDETSTETGSNSDDNTQTGFGGTDAIPVLLLTGAALVVVSDKKRKEKEDEE